MFQYDIVGSDVYDPLRTDKDRKRRLKGIILERMCMHRIEAQELRKTIS